MAIPQEDIDKVIEANDLVSIAAEVAPELKMKGGRATCCCPFHKEKTPSFQIDPNQQLWHCFGCGEGGNLVTFVEKYYDMGFVETIEWLAERANIQITKTKGKGNFQSKSVKARMMQAYKLSAEFYSTQLHRSKSAGANQARQYLASRNFGSEVCSRWQLGFAPGNNTLTKYLLSQKFSAKELIEANLCVKGKTGMAQDRFYNRVMFPIRDALGNVIAFGGRIMTDGQPKYLNTSESAIFHKSKVLYGLDKAKSNMTATGTAIVVEGYTDVIALHEAGINYAVATLGTALTKQHIRVLNSHAKSKIVYLFDGDEAGQRAAERALNFIDEMERPEQYAKKAQLVALTLPDNMDPAEYIEKHSAQDLLKLIDDAKPLLQYGIERKLSRFDMSVPGNKSKAAMAAIQVLAPIKDSLLASEYAAQIADRCGLRLEDVMSQVKKLKKPVTYESVDFQQRRNFSGNQSTSKNSSSKAQSSSKSVEGNNLGNYGNNESSGGTKSGSSTNQSQTNIKGNISKADQIQAQLLSTIASSYKVAKQVEGLCLDLPWTNKFYSDCYDLITQTFNTNNNANINEIMSAASKEDKRMANMLSRYAVAGSSVNDPVKYCHYLAYSLKVIAQKQEVEKLKQLYKSEQNDDVYKQVINAQEKLNEFKQNVRKFA